MKYVILFIWFRAANFVFSSGYNNFDNVIFANLASFLDNTDALKLPLLNNQIRTENMPKNILEASFHLKFESLPTHFRSSKLDKFWFNKFSTEEIADETFWITILHSCENDVGLKSCEGYADYAANLLINYDAQKEETKFALIFYLRAILKELINFKKYDTLIALMTSNNHEIAQKAQVCVGDYDYQHNFILLETIVLTIMDEAERINFIESLGHVMGPSIILIYMNHLPEALTELINKIEFYAEDEDVLQIIFKNYRPGMNHPLVQQFKKEILLRYFRPSDIETFFFSMVTNYLHNSVPLTDFSNTKAELALIKGDILYFFDSIGSMINIDSNDFSTDRPLFNIVLDNSEIIRELLRRDSRFFKGFFEFKFDGYESNDPRVRKLLNVYADHYADNPGTHDGIFIYPGIQNDDSGSGLLTYLNNEIDIGGNQVITFDSIIRTIMLTRQTDPQVLERTILGLIDDIIIKLTPFSSSCRFMLWRRSNFECFTKLLANDKIINFFPPIFDCLNWNLRDYVKIIRFLGYFDLYYPYREAVTKSYLRKFNKSQLMHHFLRLEEFEAFLTFFNYDFHVPDYQFKFFHYPVGIAVKEFAREYKFVVEYCGDDIEKSMKHLNSHLLNTLTIWSQEKHRECEIILENWFANPQNYGFLMRFFEVAKSTLAIPILRVKISSLRIDPCILTLLTEQGSRMNFDFDLDAILTELQIISEIEFKETLRNIKMVTGLVQKLMATTGYLDETMCKLKIFL